MQGGMEKRCSSDARKAAMSVPSGIASVGAASSMSGQRCKANASVMVEAMVSWPAR